MPTKEKSRPAGDRRGSGGAQLHGESNHENRAVPPPAQLQKIKRYRSRSTPRTDNAQEPDHTERKSLDAVRFGWLAAVTRIPHIPGRELQFASLLALNYVGMKDSRARFEQTGTPVGWPSQETIAAEMSCSRQNARAAARGIERRGFLLIKPGRGRGHSTEYWLVSPDVTAAKGNQADSLLTQGGKGNLEHQEKGTTAHGKGNRQRREKGTKLIPPVISFNHQKKSFHQSQAENDFASPVESEGEVMGQEPDDAETEARFDALEKGTLHKQVSSLVEYRSHNGSGTSSLPRKGAGSHPEFDGLLALWPNREGLDHGKAFGAWINHVIKPRVDPELVLRCGKKWCEHWQDEGSTFIPYFGIWLRDRGWTTSPLQQDLAHAREETERGGVFDPLDDGECVDETAEELNWLRRHEPEKAEAYLREIDAEQDRLDKEGEERLAELREELHRRKGRSRPQAR